MCKSNLTQRLACAVLACALASLMSCSSQQSNPKASAENSEKEKTPLHKKLVSKLRRYDGVKGNLIEGVHPVHTVSNQEAIIPPMCYTRIEGKFNPCYVCHQNHDEGRENTMNDAELQTAYSFSDLGMTNHWSNLFKDRSAEVAAISDEEIRTWVDTDNYSNLAPRLKESGFKGWIPDLENLQLAADAFDANGFALDGSGWVAFNYKPLPSTFWPTNGSTDDVMIRLPMIFRTNLQGEASDDFYRANLAIVEANLKGYSEISSLPINEKIIGKDLNKDGKLSIIEKISNVDRYVGPAEKEYIDTFLYPEGTEFLHTVRYLGFTPKGEVTLSKRMKEVRYMRKWAAYRKEVYERNYELEGFEKEAGNLPSYQFLKDYGLDNGFGWSVQGFIENVQGDLRVATYEENLFCMGCHTSIGATIDKTISFPRKVDGAAGWGYINLKTMLDAPNRGESKGEYATYLQRVGGGGEFRSNPEMQERWFNKDGSLKENKIEAISSIYELIVPSPERALELNKAYRVIVAEQSFIHGRDATVTPPVNVHDFIDNETATTLPDHLMFDWDIRLDWNYKKNDSANAVTLK